MGKRKYRLNLKDKSEKEDLSEEMQRLRKKLKKWGNES